MGKDRHGFAYVLGKFLPDFAYVLGNKHHGFAYVLGNNHYLCKVKQCCNYHDIQAITPNGKTFRLINLPFYYVGMIDKVIDNEA